MPTTDKTPAGRLIRLMESAAAAGFFAGQAAAAVYQGNAAMAGIFAGAAAHAVYEHFPRWRQLR